MNNDLLETLQSVQRNLEPQLKKLQSANGALKAAIKLASEEKADALPMHRASLKLQEAAEKLEDPQLLEATQSFKQETDKALESLGFEFAKDLKEALEAKGLTVSGRPPTLVVGELVLNIDVAARKAQWFYGKEALTRPLPLSLGAIMKAYEGQRREILERRIDTQAFLGELYKAWWDELESRPRKPQGNRLNLVETFSKVTLNRQSSRFWNAPSRGQFKDYPRPHFVRDLVLVQDDPTVSVDGKRYRLRLGTATKSQADQASRSIFVPEGALEGQYYSDISFEEATA